MLVTFFPKKSVIDSCLFQTVNIAAETASWKFRNCNCIRVMCPPLHPAGHHPQNNHATDNAGNSTCGEHIVYRCMKTKVNILSMLPYPALMEGIALVQFGG